MPKKTRKQKIHAALRREVLSQHIQTPVAPRTKTIQIAPSKKAEIRPLTAEEERSVSFFKSDLRRSLLFIVLIIGLEISLYFASINQYLKLGE